MQLIFSMTFIAQYIYLLLLWNTFRNFSEIFGISLLAMGHQNTKVWITNFNTILLPLVSLHTTRFVIFPIRGRKITLGSVNWHAREPSHPEIFLERSIHGTLTQHCTTVHSVSWLNSSLRYTFTQCLFSAISNFKWCLKLLI